MNGTTLIRNPGVESLLEVLHQERRVLERLMYRLSEANLLVEARQDRFLALASDDVGYIETQLGEVEILRAILVAGIATTRNVPESELSLREIIQRAQPEHAALLERELEALRDLTQDIDNVKHDISAASSERLAATQTAIARLVEGPAQHCGRDGSPGRSESSFVGGFRGEL